MNAQYLLTNFKKELWEFRKTLFWVPLFTAILVIVAPLVQLALLEDYQTAKIFEVLEKIQHIAEPKQFSKGALNFMMGVFTPFLILAFVIQFYYFVTCLFDERRDMSVYFWRSLPVSDALTVTVKLLTGAFVIPAAFLLYATATLLVYLLFAFIACIVLATSYDITLWQFWGEIGLISNVASLWSIILPYALWMFPLFAWLMLASSHAKKAPFLWAVLPIIALLVIEAVLVNYFHLYQGFVSTTLTDYFGFTQQLVFQSAEPHVSFKELLVNALYAKIGFVATIFGLAVMYLTYWLRKTRSHAV